MSEKACMEENTEEEEITDEINAQDESAKEV